MCPDPQLLSIYLDGELPSPWKEKLQSHIAECPKCSEKFENLKSLKSLLNDKTAGLGGPSTLVGAPGTEQEMLTAKERVWEKIESRCRPQRHMRHNSIMRRRLSIPLPIAAAAAVVILLLTAFWITGNRNNQAAVASENNTFSLAAEMDNIDEIPVIIPAADMSGVLQYLAPDGANVIIIQLPENQNFFRAGEPAIIRAADFNQNNSPRGNSQGSSHGNSQGGSHRNRGEREFKEITPGDDSQKDDSLKDDSLKDDSLKDDSLRGDTSRRRHP